MAGQNPYLKYPQIAKPKKKFRIRFLPIDKIIEVDPDRLPFGETGLPGSILDIALHHGIEIDHACGGVAACSTCHVFVKEGGKSCNEPEDFELDLLDSAPRNSFNSRLSCQTCPNGEVDLVVEVPAWNRNLVKEGPAEGS